MSLDPEKERSADFSPITYLQKDDVNFLLCSSAVPGLTHPALTNPWTASSRALSLNEMIEEMNHPEGQHGFDILDDNARSREMIVRAIEFIKSHIMPAGATIPDVIGN